MLLLVIVLHTFYQRHNIDKKIVDANGLVWTAGGKQFVVQVNEREDGELLEIGIVVVGPEKKEIYKKIEVIDRDMFGGGFVRAIQVDQDPENEIVVWHARAKYYLDFSEGKVTDVSLEQAPRQIKDLAERWHKYNVMAGMEITLWLIFVLGYYMVYFLVKGAIGLFKRKKKPID